MFLYTRGLLMNIAADFFKITYPSQQFRDHKIKRLIFKFLCSKRKRSEMDFEYQKTIAFQVAHKWEFFIDAYHQGQLSMFDITPKKELRTNKIIWQYWAQGVQQDHDLPDVVKLGFASVDFHKNDYEVIRIDDNNLKDYIDLPDFVWQKRGSNGFGYALFSDIVRLALLSAYGGVWIDATIYLSAPISKEILSQDVFMFQRLDNVNNKNVWENYDSSYFSWNCTHFINLLNSFIVAKKNNLLIKAKLDILLNFWQSQDTVPHYFMFQILYEALRRKDQYPRIELELSDTAPHKLQFSINSLFDNGIYNDIIYKSDIHKLTYFKEIVPGSIYDILLRKYSVNIK